MPLPQFRDQRSSPSNIAAAAAAVLSLFGLGLGSVFVVVGPCDARWLARCQDSPIEMRKTGSFPPLERSFNPKIAGAEVNPRKSQIDGIDQLGV